jgi:3-isopropylmalate dehydrogenase
VKATILLLPGDGIGPEVVAAAARVLRAVAEKFNHTFDLPEAMIGAAALKQGLAPLPDETLASARTADAILLGAVGDPAFDKGPSSQRPEAALLGIRKALGLFANLRPARVWPHLESAGPLKPEVLAGTDMLVVRELTGGLYYGEPRGIEADGSAAYNTMRYSRHEIDRIARQAFTAARKRRRRVTSVDKANVLETSRLWRSVVTEVGREFPDVTLDHMLVDSCAMRIALAPASFDVIVNENMFGDIPSNEAGAVVGSLGLLPSASLGTGTGLFEPVHGSAPDIAGQGVANPIAQIASLGMALRYSCDMAKEADLIDKAIAGALARGLRTGDIMQPNMRKVGTSEMGRAIVEEIEKLAA